MKNQKSTNLAPKELFLDGVLFRSQTEFRCAAFFKHMKIRYEYEPRQFKLPSGMLYNPDFLLPDYQTWLEVKPDDQDIRGMQRYKIDEFAIAYPEYRVWLSYGHPRAHHAWIEQLKTHKYKEIKHAFIVADKTQNQTRWISSADRKYSELLGSSSQKFSQPFKPENDAQLRMATGFSESIKDGDPPSFADISDRTIEKSKFAKKK